MAVGGDDSFMQSLGLLLGLTALIALFLSFFRQSTIISFIIVGVVVNLVGVEVDPTTLSHFSEVGIMVLLFMAGLEVDIDAFLKAWKAVTVVGLGQIVISTSVFSLLSILIFPLIDQPLSALSAVYFGLCMTFSSTILVLGNLKSSKAMGTVHGQVRWRASDATREKMCLGTLVLQDAASVLSLAVLAALATGTGECFQSPETAANCSSASTSEACGALSSSCTFSTSYKACQDACSYLDLSIETDGGESVCTAISSCSFASSSEGGSVATAILLLIAKLVAACLILYALARFVLEKTFELFANSLELLYLGALGYCTGLAAIAIRLGFSGEITAFLAGVSLTQLEYKLHIESKLDPIKSLGVAIFFIALGLQLDIDHKLVDALPVGFMLAFITLVTTLPLFILLGYAARLKAYNCFMIGMLMNQISEFSLILCTLTVRAGVLEPTVLTVMTVAAVVSIVFSSFGHIFIDQMYSSVQQWRVLKMIDAQHHKQLLQQDSGLGILSTINIHLHNTSAADRSVEMMPMHRDHNVVGPATLTHKALVNLRPAEFESPEWVFQDQLKNRTVDELVQDLQEVETEMEAARTAMSLTAEEQRLAKEDSKPNTARLSKQKKKAHHGRGRGLTVTTSEKSDIMHGLIEGYVIMNRHLLFCCLRGGRMMFWDDQHDVGHVPPKEVWDVSGMTIEVIKDEVEHMQKLKREKSERSGIESGGDSLRSRGKGAGLVHTLRRILKGNLFTSQASTTKFEEGKEDGEEEGDDIEAGTRKGGENAENVEDEEESIRCDSDRECDGDSNVGASDSDSEEDAKFHPWEWTIVLAHLHRTEDSAETGEDPMKLEIHGLEDHSDHDVEDWRDALSVVLATLNPIALRRAHIKEAILGLRREVAESVRESVSSLATGFRGRKRITSLTKRMEAHGHRQEIICIGYNEMFPAVLALADATGKEVVVVEYDIQKIKTVKKRYNRKQRVLDADAAKGGGRRVKDRRQSKTELDNRTATDKEREKEGGGDILGGAGGRDAAAAAAAAAAEVDEIKELRGVTCDYADIHDPESWEELEMDQAFMVVCCMKGAHHAEKAIINWLKRHGSDTIFVGVSANNADALHLYDHGAHYVLQSDALAMRSTKQIFLDTVAKWGDGSHLKAAGVLHAKRLAGLKRDDKRRFLYETGAGAG